MQVQIKTSRVTVAKGRLLTLPADIEVGCVSGSVWITQENDIRDVILTPGQTCRFDRQGPVLAYGLRESLITTSVAVPAAQPDFVQSLRTRVVDHMRRVAKRFVDHHRPATAR